MNQNQTLRQTVMIFMFVLSSILLRNPVLTSRTLFATSMTTVLFGILLSAFYHKLYLSPRKLKSSFVKFVFTFVACIIVCISCAVFIFDYTLSVSYINEFYSSFLFMLSITLVIIGISCFAAYSGYRTISMLCGMLLWAVPLFLSFTYFSFLEAGFRKVQSTAFTIPLSSHFVFDGAKGALFLFSDIAVLLYLIYSNKNMADPASFKKLYITAITISVFVFLAETIKCGFLFGTDLLAIIQEPNLAATRLIPGLHIPEIYTVSLSCALIIKLSVYLAAANALMKKYFLKNTKTGPVILLGVLTFFLFSAFLRFLPREFLTQNGLFLCILSILTILFPLLAFLNARCHKK